MLNRKGIIRIPKETIDKNAEEVLESLKDILVLDVEYNPCSMIYEYLCCSKYFDLVEPMNEIPRYSFLLIDDNIKLFRVPQHFKDIY